MSSTAQSADVVICGAGIAGISAAYFLAARQGLANVLLVDERPPLTLTSDKSSEGYRNWWPGPGDAMVRFMNRSIDLLEELAGVSDNRFHLNRRGYVYLTADPLRAAALREEARAIAALGAGPLRDGQDYFPAPPSGYEDQPMGADILCGAEQVRTIFPFIASDAVAALHARRCGWLSAQQLGMYLLEKARAAGAKLQQGQVCAVHTAGNRVTGVSIRHGSETRQVHTGTFVNAAGPLLRQVGALLELDLPVYNELHGKVAFEDTLGVIPRETPMMIWADPLSLPWAEEEHEMLAAEEESAWMLGELPAGLHFRPEGGPGSQTILALWAYHVATFVEPAWPLRFAPEFVELVLRGLARMVPGLAPYLARMAPPYVDGGYYCKTRENRPLIGPLPVAGAYVFGALSGFGIMAAPAGGELLAAAIVGNTLPSYAPAFDLRRYTDPAYAKLLPAWDAMAGQL